MVLLCPGAGVPFFKTEQAPLRTQNYRRKTVVTTRRLCYWHTYIMTSSHETIFDSSRIRTTPKLFFFLPKPTAPTIWPSSLSSPWPPEGRYQNGTSHNMPIVSAKLLTFRWRNSWLREVNNLAKKRNADGHEVLRLRNHFSLVWPVGYGFLSWKNTPGLTCEPWHLKTPVLCDAQIGCRQNNGVQNHV